MILALYVFIAWVGLIVFILIPKRLSKIDNIIIFISTSMVILDLFSRFTQNLGLIWYDEKPENFYSMCIFRSVIIPVCLLIFANLLALTTKTAGKAVSAAGILLSILLVAYLSLQTGIIKSVDWNIFFTLITLTGLMAFSALLGKVLRSA